MLISICIPQYNRCRTLLAVLETIRKQDHPEIEVIISDDASTDDSEKLIPDYIRAHEKTSAARFRYIRNKKNRGYDANLRAALAAGEGEYLFILGNDDALPKDDTVSRLVSVLKDLDHPEVAFSSMELYGEGNQRVRQFRETKVLGSGPEIAAKNFRYFCPVMGIVMKRSVFKKYDTSEYDGSIYVQIYLVVRAVASGARLACISESLVAKDVHVPGEKINTYEEGLALANDRLRPKTGGLDQVGRVTCEALLPSVPISERGKYIFSVYSQLLLRSYPYWLWDYRKKGVYRAAVNLAWGCFPCRLIKVDRVPLFIHVRLFALYFVITAFCLLAPIKFLEAVKQKLLGSHE